MAEVVHDADLFDEKFGRKEGFGIDEVIEGLGPEKVLSDQELLKRGECSWLRASTNRSADFFDGRDCAYWLERTNQNTKDGCFL